MDLTPEEKQRIEEEERKRIAEEQYREEVRARLKSQPTGPQANPTTAVLPTQQPKRSGTFGKIVLFVIVVAAGWLLVGKYRYNSGYSSWRDLFRSKDEFRLSVRGGGDGIEVEAAAPGLRSLVEDIERGIETTSRTKPSSSTSPRAATSVSDKERLRVLDSVQSHRAGVAELSRRGRERRRATGVTSQTKPASVNEVRTVCTASGGAFRNHELDPELFEIGDAFVRAYGQRFRTAVESGSHIRYRSEDSARDRQESCNAYESGLVTVERLGTVEYAVRVFNSLNRYPTPGEESLSNAERSRRLLLWDAKTGVRVIRTNLEDVALVTAEDSARNLISKLR